MTTGARTVVYHAPHAASFGDRFEASMTNRRVEIGFGSRRLHFTVHSSRFRRSVQPAAHSHGGSVLWRAMGYVGCTSLVLGLVFASGSMLRASPPVAEYAVVLPIDAKAAPITSHHKAKRPQAVRARLVAPIVPVMSAADDWSVAPASVVDNGGLGIARPDPDVATLSTVNGERAVAVYGPARLIGGKSCRDVNVFVRDVDGRVSTSPTTECKAR